MNNFIAVAALSLLGAFQAPRFSPVVTSTDAELWGETLEQVLRETARPAYVLLDRTVSSPQFRSHLVWTPRPLLFDPLLRRNETVAVVTGLSLPSNVQLVDSSVLLRRASGAEAAVDVGVFARAFPNTTLIQLSLPAYSEDGSRAILYYWATGGFDDARGGCYVFEKQEERWKIVELACSWIT